jgi:hypothetical protein
MAKHGHIKDHERLLKKPPRPAERVDGHGRDYKFFRTLPTFPPEAYYLRRSATIRAALQEVRRQPVPAPLGAPLRKFIDDLLRILGPFPYNYGRARREFETWSDRYTRAGPGSPRLGALPARPEQRNDATPQAVLARELHRILSALLLAYEDPMSFFDVLLRERYPSDFDAGIRKLLGDSFDGASYGGTLAAWEPTDIDRLFGYQPAEYFGRLLWTWGYGALLNTDVAFVFQNLRPEILREVIALAEGRTGMREGRPRGAHDGKARPATLRVRARNEAVERGERAERAQLADYGSTGRSIAKVAREAGVPVGTVKKALYRKRH